MAFTSDSFHLFRRHISWFAVVQTASAHTGSHFTFTFTAANEWVNFTNFRVVGPSPRHPADLGRSANDVLRDALHRLRFLLSNGMRGRGARVNGIQNEYGLRCAELYEIHKWPTATCAELLYRISPKSGYADRNSFTPLSKAKLPLCRTASISVESVQNRTVFHSHNELKYDFYCTDFHENCICWTALHGGIQRGMSSMLVRSNG